MTKRVKWILSGTLVILACGGWVALSHNKRDAAKRLGAGAVFTVKRGELLVTITESGSLRAVEETTIRCELPGQSQLIFLAEEGTWVKKDTILAEFDSNAIQERVIQQEIEYESAVSAWVQARENLEVRKSQNASEITAAELKLVFAGQDLAKFLEAEWPLQIKQQKANITLAQDELTRAEDRLNWTRQLQAKGYATRGELESDELAVRRKQLEIEQGQEKLRMMENYEFPQTKMRKESDVKQAQEELERVKRRAIAELSRVESELKAKEANKQSRETQLKSVRENLKQCKIVAPQEGLVVHSKGRWGQEPLRVGATVNNRQDIIQLSNTNGQMAEIKVHESRVNQLLPGQAAYVTIDAMPDSRFKGRVNKIAPMPDPGNWMNPNLKVYNTTILIDDALPADVKPGLSARAEVIVTRHENVLTVPIQSVTARGRQRICYVRKNGAPVPVEVTLGDFNDTSVLVLSGLQEGDIVLLSPPSNEEAEALGLSVVEDKEVVPADLERRPPPPTKDTAAPGATNGPSRREARRQSGEGRHGP